MEQGESMTGKPVVEFENDRVRVIRVKQTGPGSLPPATRNDRLIIYLCDGQINRKEGTVRETNQRKAGDVVWRGRSSHEIEVTQKGQHEVLIIELK